MSSKFAQALQAKQASLQASEEAAAKETPEVVHVQASPKREAKAPKPMINMEPPKGDSPEVAASLKGKRSSSEYTQVNVYLKKETTHEAKIALLTSRDQRDFSELMEDLLSAWVKQTKR